MQSRNLPYKYPKTLARFFSGQADSSDISLDPGSAALDFLEPPAPQIQRVKPSELPLRLHVPI